MDEDDFDVGQYLLDSPDDECIPFESDEFDKDIDKYLENSKKSQTEIQTPTSSRPTPKTRVVIKKEDIVKLSDKSLKEAAAIFGVCETTLKRKCRKVGIERWQSIKQRKDGSPIKKIHQPEYSMIVKANHGEETVIFTVGSDILIEDLHKELEIKFCLENGSFETKYEDKVGDWITINCTGDLKFRMNELKNQSQQTMDLQVSSTKN